MGRPVEFNEHKSRVSPYQADSEVTALVADQKQNHLQDVYLHIEDPAWPSPGLHHSAIVRKVPACGLLTAGDVKFLEVTALKRTIGFTVTGPQRRDTTTVPINNINNVGDFVIIRQTHKRLLSDTRVYGGTLLDSAHRLLVKTFDIRTKFRRLGSN